MDWARASWYSLPWYFLLPIGASAVLLALSVRLSLHPRRDVFNRLIRVHFWYAVLAIAGFFPFALLDRTVTGALLYIALLFYGLVLGLPLLVLAALAFGKIGPAPAGRRILLLAYAAGLLAVGAYAQFIEPYRIEITRERFLLSGAPPIRIVHLSDIQCEYLTRREKDAAEIISGLCPDLIVLTGDYYTGTREHQQEGFRAARYLLESLHAPLGVFAVTGDSVCDPDHEALCAGTPAVLLRNENRVIDTRGGKLAVVGLDYGNPDWEKAFRGLDPGLPIVLLAHSPSVAFDPRLRPSSIWGKIPFPWIRTEINPELKRFGADLILVGHTHGGQVALPLLGPLTSATRYGPKYARGRFELGGTAMYVNRGLGMDGRFGPKIRFFSRPEIAVIEIAGVL